MLKVIFFIQEIRTVS